MRIAIQISGEIRASQYTYETIFKNILNIPENEVDIFIHTWNNEDSIKQYNARAYELENYEEKKDLHVLPRSMSMYYSIWRANEVRKDYAMKNDITYDIVMRYRTDCVVNENPFISIDTRSDILMIPLAKNGKAVDGPGEQDTGSAYCDWLAWGTPKAMDIYCKTYHTWLLQPFHPMPESMLSMNLKANKITKETILQRPTLDFYLVDINGKAR